MATAESTHTHAFNTGNPLAETNTGRAAMLTAVMMVAEIVGGWTYNSMALLADGWHMSSHTLALGLSVLAYVYARRYAHDPRFAFGTWKIEVLASYTSALALLGIAALMLVQSVQRLIAPSPIAYQEAIAIAALGLAVNLACAWLLRGGHRHAGHPHHDAYGRHHAQGHAHAHHHQRGHADLNLRAAYLHVVTDAATSVLAIVALTGGLLWGAAWLDPVMGIVGAVLVAVWARGLIRDSASVLLDAEMQAPIVADIRKRIAASPVPARIDDLHVWRVGRNRYACILGLSVTGAADGDTFRQLLAVREELVHVTVEIHAVG